MKKISNLLMMALLTLDMGLTSCDEQLDNAVTPSGVMPDVEVTSITLNATSQVLNVDDYFALTATVEPADADYEKIIWSSSDETIATVDENGIIHAVAEGNVIITAQAGNMKATCDILVQDVYDDKQYKEASWDGTNSKVVFTKKSVESVALIDNDFSGSITSGWYSVTGDNVVINGTISLTDDLHLILCDGAKLTINGQLDCRTNGKNLYIYGQKKGDGKLNVTNNSGNAINSNSNLYIDIHGGEVTASAAGNLNFGLNTGYLAVYGGKLTATSGDYSGINFQNTIDVYGGVVEATSNATSSSDACYGIKSGGFLGSQILTVYGGKVTATGNGILDVEDYGSGFGCYVKSGTSGIKFYFSGNGTDWDEGTSYGTATNVITTKKRYAKAE